MPFSPSLPLDRDRGQAAKYGPWVLVAGASDGTGEAFVRQLAALGLNVILVARRENVLEALSGEIRAAHGVETRVLVQDLTLPDAADNILRRTSDLDVGLYVSNAGAGSDASASDFIGKPVSHWHELTRMNVNTVMECAHGFAARFVDRGSGGLLFMSSMAALGGLPWMSVYAAVKAFDMVLAEGLWGEFSAAGIDVDVLAVMAPFMDTPTMRRTMGGGTLVGMTAYDPDEVVRQALARLPQGPVLLLPPELGSAELESQISERGARVLEQISLGKSLIDQGKGMK